MATASTVPVIHKLQFSTYLSPRELRRRHASWPADLGKTTSHGRLAGMWVRVGDHAAWFCLERHQRAVRLPVPTEAPPAG
jgi:hypothetical protein